MLVIWRETIYSNDEARVEDAREFGARNSLRAQFYRLVVHCARAYGGSFRLEILGWNPKRGSRERERERKKILAEKMTLSELHRKSYKKVDSWPFRLAKGECRMARCNTSVYATSIVNKKI